ncbi:MAG: hypothetical protein HZC42_03095 [Candidatus Eisenbacteria bacterium]|nr:hypothetical protein [Candidatus Eisenbacteria bacterium]
MTRTIWALILSFFLLPETAQAVQLTWASGRSNLKFTSARLCTLMVQTGAAEPLPSEWHLLWVAKSTAGQAFGVLSEPAAVADTARIRSLALPSGPVEGESNQSTADLYVSGPSAPHVARYVLDVSAGAVVKFDLVAYRATGTNSFDVLRSPQATLNGGLAAAYPPSLLHVLSTHDGPDLLIRAAGTGLGGVRSARLTGADTSWSVSLTILKQTDTTLVATASVAARLPACQLEVFTPEDQAATASLPADGLMAPLSAPAYSSYLDLSGYIRPKDFAFFYDGMGKFHLIYIRHNTQLSDCTQPDLNEKSFAHVSGDILSWSSQGSSFRVSAHGWDKLHVWAPTIVQNGSDYFVFYTGVDSIGDQRIGYAKTTDLNTPMSTWTRYTTWVFGADSTFNHWALNSHPQACRDPYVVKDPTDATRWLMYYTAIPSSEPTWQSVGVARSFPNSLTRWQDIGPLYMSDYRWDFSLKTESPHLIPHVNADASTSWYVFFTSDFSIMWARNEYSPYDTAQVYSATRWDQVSKRRVKPILSWQTRRLMLNIHAAFC